jgi:hypothetical protein
MTVDSSIILGLHKRVGNLFAAVDRADENKESTSDNYEAKGSSGVVAFVVCSSSVSYECLARNGENMDQEMVCRSRASYLEQPRVHHLVPGS